MTDPARVAQSVEQLTRNEQVASSILASGSVRRSFPGPSLTPVAPALFVPAYFGPWERGHWRRLLADRPATVVINPDSGPGVRVHDGYRELVEQLTASGASVLGYVATTYLAKPLGDCIDEADRHRRWYGVNGIFWDEMPRRDAIHAVRTLTIAAGRPLANRSDPTRSPAVGARCVFNAGGPVPRRWMVASPDSLWVTFEGSAEAYVRYTDEASDGGWRSDAMLRRQCHLVHACGGLRPRFPAGLGAAYSTSDRLPNPWDVYESPWSDGPEV